MATPLAIPSSFPSVIEIDGYCAADHVCLIAYGWGLPAQASSFIESPLTKGFPYLKASSCLRCPAQLGGQILGPALIERARDHLQSASQEYFAQAVKGEASRMIQSRSMDINALKKHQTDVKA
jgi:hypothetical protein